MFIYIVEKFLNTSIDKEVADKVFSDILSAKENIMLTGMPGSGKSTFAAELFVFGVVQ